ncbi:MAG: cupin domain-containing protein [Gammaproteobacteria bacterium]|nr:cupin domain-containing protein [Gammaproteobacteria bacterium]
MWRLQGFDAERFVAEYWQKKPCLLRAALAEFESPISPEELAGLACEEDVHSRLVRQGDDDRSWDLRYGPFDASDFRSLPQSHYTLLVSECEKWLPELTDLLDLFRFVPDWRIDDLMISYAAPQGSVGPHVDEYDVFLLQAQGTRRWAWAESRGDTPRLVEGLELAILENFAADQEQVLQPGDMLYLPPGHAHHGVALEPCMTFSIGFRAPTAASALESFALETERFGRDIARYRDPELETGRHPAELTTREIDEFRRLALALAERSDALWPDAIGKMLSDSAVIGDPDAEQPVYVSDLQGGQWLRHPESRLLYHRADDAIRLYFNGRVLQLPHTDEILALVQRLCDERELAPDLVNACLRHDALETALLELAAHNAIIKSEI